MNDKTDKIRFFPKDSAAIEAMDWISKFKTEPLTPETEARFYKWISENPENKMELELMSAIWDYSVVLKEHPLVIADVGAPSFRNQKSAKRKWFGIPRLSWSPMRTIIVAVSVLLIVLGVWLIQDQPDLIKTCQTAIGEQETVFLADGSSIHLDTKTVVAIAFSSDSRKVELKSGRAVFSVHHDPERPFVVLAGDVFVRAIGTEFDVYKRSNGRVAVAVTEGRVQVGPKAALAVLDSEKILKTKIKKMPPPNNKIDKMTNRPKKLPIKVVGPGQRVLVDEHKKSIDVEEAVDIQKIGSWRYGKLYFSGTPLSDVIEEVNRYFDVEILIGDKRLNDIRISTVFKLSDLKYFITTLEEAVPVFHKKLLNDQIVLYGRNDSETLYR